LEKSETFVELDTLLSKGCWCFDIGTFCEPPKFWTEIDFIVFCEVQLLEEKEYSLYGQSIVKLIFKTKLKKELNFIFEYPKIGDTIDLASQQFQSLRVYPTKEKAEKEFLKQAKHILKDTWSGFNNAKRNNAFKIGIKNNREVLDFLNNQIPELLI